MINISTLIADEVEFAAHWRWMKASEYSDDADRNCAAAARLERIAEDLKKAEGSQWHWRLQALAEKNPDGFSEILSELSRTVGFRSSAKTGAEFVQELFFLA